MKPPFYLRFGKRWFDAVFSTLGLLLLSPFLLATAIAVKLDSSGPAFFKQPRIGRLGKPFLIIKFRSMKGGGAAGSKLTPAADPRITRLGAWLRRTKIDELPQLFNVMLGDMSLVGPRPEVSEFVSHYTKEQLAVLDARPGMTGPSANVYEEELLASQTDKERFYINSVLPKKLQIDLHYTNNITFSGDLYTLFQTFSKLSIRVYELYKQIPHSSHAPSHNSSR